MSKVWLDHNVKQNLNSGVVFPFEHIVKNILDLWNFLPSYYGFLEWYIGFVFVWNGLLRCISVFSSVIKPGLARRVDPGPGPVRAIQKTGARKKPARPGLTRPDPGETRNIYTNSPVGKFGKVKGKLNFYPNFFLCSSNNQILFFC